MKSKNPEEWWAERCAHIADLMKITGVGEIIIRRKDDGKYSFEVTPEKEVTECRVMNEARFCTVAKEWRIPGDRCLACSYSSHNA